MHAKDWARRAAVVLALSLLPLVVSEHSSAAPKDRDAYKTDGRRLAEELGLSPAEGEKRLRLQEVAGSLDMAAQSRWPDTFAGSWIDHRAGGIVSVAFTADADSNVAALGESFPEPTLLRPVTMQRSLARLETLQQQLIADREEARAGRLVFPGIDGARYDLSIDVRRNVVVVIADGATAATRAAFAARYGPDVEVDTGPTAVPHCTRDNCSPTLRSGLKIGNDMGTWYWCSTAFAARRWSNEWAMLTAGHCDFDPVTGQWAKHNGTYYGYRETQQEWGQVDAEFHRVVYNGFNASPAIWVSPSETAREVRAKASWAGIEDGSYVCKSGATTGLTCGFIQTKYHSPSYIPSGNRFIRASLCSNEGDSGSGVFSAYRALGILSGGAGDCGNPNVAWTTFGALDYAESALGVSVITTVPRPGFIDIDAYLGDSEILAFFDSDLDCWSVDYSDFTARISVAGVSQSLTVEYVDCNYDYDGVLNIGVSLAGAPVVFVTGMTVSATLTGLVTDEWGNEALRTTRSTSVTTPH